MILSTSNSCLLTKSALFIIFSILILAIVSISFFTPENVPNASEAILEKSERWRGYAKHFSLPFPDKKINNQFKLVNQKSPLTKTPITDFL